MTKSITITMFQITVTTVGLEVFNAVENSRTLAVGNTHYVIIWINSDRVEFDPGRRVYFCDKLFGKDVRLCHLVS